MDYQKKYLEYKQKYLALKSQFGGVLGGDVLPVIRMRINALIMEENKTSTDAKLQAIREYNDYLYRFAENPEEEQIYVPRNNNYDAPEETDYIDRIQEVARREANRFLNIRRRNRQDKRAKVPPYVQYDEV